MPDIEEYPVVVERSVRWGEMDAFQHVNNVEYFRYFEDARIAYFQAMDIYDPTTSGVLPERGPILGATSCQFLAPLSYPDEIAIGARTKEVGEDRFVLEYAIASQQADRIVAVGDSVVVSYNYHEGRTIAVPQPWRRAIERIED